MPAKINLEAMPDAQRESFLRALAKEIYRIREDPALWARVEARANTRREINGTRSGTLQQG